jgi:hypothetical protein
LHEGFARIVHAENAEKKNAKNAKKKMSHGLHGRGTDLLTRSLGDKFLKASRGMVSRRERRRKNAEKLKEKKCHTDCTERHGLTSEKFR